ncbi:alpha/beta fold hydrolase [Sinorhizobium meliloti]|uniref:alpha/beta fold hydrolase n=1 Tax=Rhizobium meliloti TaxID=382 RepID=UPI0004057B4F|nr:alpha/beta fold hydrolase [Sinorhizobium meliloti]MDE4620858.1 alpha/beta fold hydrolase [Sinorhizobium meliloti]
MEPMWLRKPRNATTIVFVHGLFSSNETAWLHPSGLFWPKLVCDETQLRDIGVYLFSYRTDVHSGTFSLENAVDAMRERFRLDGLFENDNVGSGLIFVCHSMGGILARRFVVAQQLALVDRKIPIGLFLIASPSLGSEYANFVEAIAPFYNAQIDILRFSQENQWLNALDKDFINIKEGERLPIFGKELVEDNFIGTNRFFRKRQIVQPISGARYFGEPVKIEHTDHFTIAKPASPQSIQHRLLVEFANTVARRHRQDQSRERPAPFESDNPVLLEWSDVLGHKLTDAPRTISQVLYENRLKVATICLVPLLLAFGFSYFGLIRERAAEAELLIGGSARIRGTDGTIFLFTTAKKIIEYDSTGSLFPETVGEFKYLGPIAIQIKETHSDVILKKQGFQIPPGLGASPNIVGLSIGNAEWLDDLDPLGSMPHLEALIIGKPKFSSLHFLTKFPNLRLLLIQDANITDLEPLAALSELRQLFLNDLPRVSDLKPLRRLSKLQCISLRGLPEVKSVETLLALPNLTTISIRESGISLPPELEQKRGSCFAPRGTSALGYSYP